MFQIVTNISTKDIDQPFDNVFFAAPWHSSPLAKEFTLPLETDIPYVIWFLVPTPSLSSISLSVSDPSVTFAYT
jgi:hypothetical protein